MVRTALHSAHEIRCAVSAAFSAGERSLKWVMESFSFHWLQSIGFFIHFLSFQAVIHFAELLAPKADVGCDTVFVDFQEFGDALSAQADDYVQDEALSRLSVYLCESLLNALSVLQIFFERLYAWVFMMLIL